MNRPGSAWLTVVVLAGLSGAVGMAGAQEQRPAGEVRVTPWGRVLDFSADGGWRTRARRVAQVRSQLVAGRDFTRLNAAVAAGAPFPAAAAVSGTLRVPAVMFQFPDRGTGAGNDTSVYRRLLFDAAAPAGTPYSLRSYYTEISNGLLDYVGRVVGWITLGGTEVTYTGAPGSCPGNPYGTGNCNGIWSDAAYGALLAGLRQALAAVDAQVDFAQFDGDGNGIVDFALFLHSERDGACLTATNNHIWAHRSSGLGYTTNDPSPAGGNVVVSDYIIQSAVGGSSGCDSTQVMAIGTAAHESGHAFGLPDLYDTSNQGEGIGEWGLMGSGNWATQGSPAHMEAWSRNELGWITVVPLTASGTYALGPTAIGDTTYLITPTRTNPRGESFLLENRQGVLSDSAVIRVHCDESGLSFPANCGGGLAIWHIDGIKTLGFAVNAGTPQGVLLTQADGLGQLQSGANRGDAGDLYPGTGQNTVLSHVSTPAVVMNSDGAFAGFVVDSIRQMVPGGAMSFRLGFWQLLVVASSGNGTVTSNPSVPSDTLLPPGTTVTLAAVAGAGALFEGWSGDTATANDTLRLTMDRSWSVEAPFALPLVASFGTAAPGTMGASYSLAPTVSGGRGTYTWSLAAGALPAGLTLGGNGTIAGVPEETGEFSFTARVVSGSQSLAFPLTVSVSVPQLTTASVLSGLVGVGAGGPLSTDERRYLDLLGNRNGSFDVGDFLAFVRTTGGAVSAATMAELLRTEGGR